MEQRHEPTAGLSGPQSSPETDETQTQGDEEQEKSVLKLSQSDHEDEDDEDDDDLTQLVQPQVDDPPLPETQQKIVQDTAPKTMQYDTTCTDEGFSEVDASLIKSPPRVEKHDTPATKEKEIVWSKSTSQIPARVKEKKGKEREVTAPIQVPSTPRATQPLKTPKSIRYQQTPGLFRDQSEALANEDRLNGSPSKEEKLPPFDWEGTHERFDDEIRKVCREEEKLSVQIDQYSKLLNAWAAGASQRDTNRASKRLKTRERFVQLSEDRLHKKEQHVEQVVSAFEAALDLLGTTK
ncbi:hypothetical protein HYFRA_00003261 [Hymenoscyphus fraxineus]|uniref:Uncharacterized protein n=1 Tax=Hymenoscyphus fraxineus TaxID=746836 RepID=A0A9N9KT26_9HELO|nr:hypothetical protein HYFRA_00003261 [Hymenoscyphus fraxineus]